MANDKMIYVLISDDLLKKIKAQAKAEGKGVSTLVREACEIAFGGSDPIRSDVNLDHVATVHPIRSDVKDPIRSDVPRELESVKWLREQKEKGLLK